MSTTQLSPGCTSRITVAAPSTQTWSPSSMYLNFCSHVFVPFLSREIRRPWSLKLPSLSPPSRPPSPSLSRPQHLITLHSCTATTIPSRRTQPSHHLLPTSRHSLLSRRYTHRLAVSNSPIHDYHRHTPHIKTVSANFTPSTRNPPSIHGICLPKSTCPFPPLRSSTLPVS